MKGSKASGPAGVDAYLARVPAESRNSLVELQRTIRGAAPQATEVISYGMPAFRYLGILVYYAAFKDHCSFFPGSVVTLRKFAAEVKPFAVAKGTLHFTPEHPLPARLVRRIVKARVAENEARARAKSRPVVRRSRGSR